MSTALQMTSKDETLMKFFESTRSRSGFFLARASSVSGCGMRTFERRWVMEGAFTSSASSSSTSPVVFGETERPPSRERDAFFVFAFSLRRRAFSLARRRFSCGWQWWRWWWWRRWWWWWWERWLGGGKE